jgi:hypothetical protein
MKEYAGSHAHPREEGLTLIKGGGASPAVRPRFPQTADPPARSAEGFPSPLAERFREIHAPVSKETACAACRDELGAPEMNYRIVLRCTTAS